MEKTIIIEKKENFNALKKFINLFLFDDLNCPELIDNEYKMGNGIINLLEKINHNGEVTDLNSAIEYFGKKILQFIELSSDADRKNLFACYKNSTMQKHIEMIVSFQSTNCTNSQTTNINKIKLNLIEYKKLSIEILTYFRVQFTDIISFIPLNIDVIDQKNYNLLLKKYLRHLSLQEIMMRIL